MATNKTVTVTTVPTLSGDSVDYYNVYSSVDGLLGTMSVAEAASGKVFSLNDVDQNITVKTVWNTAGESSLSSNAVTVSLGGSFLFEDDFAGTTINTSKWDVTIDAGNNVAFSQNNQLSVVFDGDTNESANVNSMLGDSTLDLDDIAAVTFDLTQATQSSGKWGVGLTKDNPLTGNQDKIAIIDGGTLSSNLYALLKEGGSNTSITLETVDITTVKTFKIVIDATNVIFNYWNGSSWTVLETVAHSSSGNWYPAIWGWDAAESVSPLIVENYKIVDTDFSTQRP